MHPNALFSFMDWSGTSSHFSANEWASSLFAITSYSVSTRRMFLRYQKAPSHRKIDHLREPPQSWCLLPDGPARSIFPSGNLILPSEDHGQVRTTKTNLMWNNFSFSRACAQHTNFNFSNERRMWSIPHDRTRQIRRPSTPVEV